MNLDQQSINKLGHEFETKFADIIMERDPDATTIVAALASLSAVLVYVARAAYDDDRAMELISTAINNAMEKSKTDHPKTKSAQ